MTYYPFYLIAVIVLTSVFALLGYSRSRHAPNKALIFMLASLFLCIAAYRLLLFTQKLLYGAEITEDLFSGHYVVIAAAYLFECLALVLLCGFSEKAARIIQYFLSGLLIIAIVSVLSLNHFFFMIAFLSLGMLCLCFAIYGVMKGEKRLRSLALSLLVMAVVDLSFTLHIIIDVHPAFLGITFDVAYLSFYIWTGLLMLRASKPADSQPASSAVSTDERGDGEEAPPA